MIVPLCAILGIFWPTYFLLVILYLYMYYMFRGVI